MVKRFLVTGGVILTAVAVGMALAVLPRLESPAPAPRLLAESDVPEKSPSTPPEEPPAPSSGEAKGYLLGSFGGRVSVLSPDTGEPEMIFDIFLRTLPDADQQLLQEGIRVETYGELTRLIEDYIS